MKLSLFIIGLLFFSFQSFGQIDEVVISQVPDSIMNNSGASKLLFLKDKLKAEELARLDIKNGYPFLNLVSGIAPDFSAEQIDFEKNFNAYYYEHGCISPPIEIAEAYDFIVLDYLDKKYGNNCIDKVRKDVIGFEKWKNKK